MTRNLRQTFHESHLYHGTPEEFAPGDIIKPASEVGKPASNRSDVAYATPDIYTAKFMAWEQNNFNGENFKEDSQTNPPTENVYRVEPVDPTDTKRQIGVKQWVPHRLLGAGTISDEITSPSGFRVLSRVQHPQEIINRIWEMNNRDPKRRGYGRNQRGGTGITRPSWGVKNQSSIWGTDHYYGSYDKDEYSEIADKKQKELERYVAANKAKRRKQRNRKQ